MRNRDAYSDSKNWDADGWNRALFNGLSYEAATAPKIREEPARNSIFRLGGSREATSESDRGSDEVQENVARDKIAENYLEEKGLLIRDSAERIHLTDPHKAFKALSPERYAGDVVSNLSDVVTLPEKLKWESEKQRVAALGLSPEDQAIELQRVATEIEKRQKFNGWTSEFEEQVVNEFLNKNFFTSTGLANDALMANVNSYRDRRPAGRPGNLLTGGLRYSRHADAYLGVISLATDSLDIGMFTNEHFTFLDALHRKVQDTESGLSVRVRTNKAFNVINRVAEAVLGRIEEEATNKGLSFRFSTSETLGSGKKVTDHFKVLGANLDSDKVSSRVLAIGSANVTQAALGKMVDKFGRRFGDMGTNVESTFVLSFDLVEKGLMNYGTFISLTEQAKLLMDWVASGKTSPMMDSGRSISGLESKLLDSRGLSDAHKKLFEKAAAGGRSATLQIVTYNIGSIALGEIEQAVRAGTKVDILLGARYDFSTGNAADMEVNKSAVAMIRALQNKLAAEGIDVSKLQLIEDAQRLVHAKTTSLRVGEGRNAEYFSIYGSMNLDDEQYSGRYSNEELQGPIRNAGIYLTSADYAGLAAEFEATSVMARTSKYYSKTPAGLSVPVGWEINSENKAASLKDWYDNASFGEDNVKWSEIIKSYGLNRSAVRPTQMGAKIRIGGKLNLTDGSVIDVGSLYEFTVTQTTRGNPKSLYIPELTKFINSVYGVQVAESLSDLKEAGEAKEFSALHVIGAASSLLQQFLESKVLELTELYGVEKAKVALRDPIQLGKLKAEIRKFTKEAFQNFAGIEPGEPAYGAKEFARLVFIADKENRLSFNRKFPLDANTMDAFYRGVITQAGESEGIYNLKGLPAFAFMAQGLSKNKGKGVISAARLFAMEFLQALPATAKLSRKFRGQDGSEKELEEYFLMLPGTKLEQMSQRLQTNLAARNLAPTGYKYKSVENEYLKEVLGYRPGKFGVSRFVAAEAQNADSTINQEKVRAGIKFMGFMAPFMAGDNAYLIAQQFQGTMFSDSNLFFSMRIGNSPNLASEMADILEAFSEGGDNFEERIKKHYPGMEKRLAESYPGASGIDRNRDFIFFTDDSGRKKLYLSAKILKGMEYRIAAASFYEGDTAAVAKQFLSLAGTAGEEGIDTRVGLILDVTEGEGLSITTGPGYRTLTLQAELVRPLTSGDRSVLQAKNPYLFIEENSRLVQAIQRHMGQIDPFSRIGGSMADMNILFSSSNIKVGDVFIQTGIEVITNDTNNFLENKIRDLVVKQGSVTDTEYKNNVRQFVGLLDKLSPFIETETGDVSIRGIRDLLTGIALETGLPDAALQQRAANELIGLLSRTKTLLGKEGTGLSISRNPAEVAVAFLAFGMHAQESLAELQKPSETGKGTVLESFVRELGYTELLPKLQNGELTINDLPEQLITRIIPMTFYSSPSATNVPMSSRTSVNLLNYHAGDYTNAFYDLVALDSKVRRKQGAYHELLINVLSEDMGARGFSTRRSFWGKEMMVGGLDFNLLTVYKPGFEAEYTRILEILRDLQGYGKDPTGVHKKIRITSDDIKALTAELTSIQNNIETRLKKGGVVFNAVGSLESAEIQEILRIQDKAGVGARTVRIAKIGGFNSKTGIFEFDPFSRDERGMTDVRMIDVNFLSPSSLRSMGSYGDYSAELQRLQVEIERRMGVLEKITLSRESGKAFNYLNEAEAEAYTELMHMIGQFQQVQKEAIATGLQKSLGGQYSITGKNMVAGTAPDIPLGTMVLGYEMMNFLKKAAISELTEAVSDKKLLGKPAADDGETITTIERRKFKVVSNQDALQENVRKLINERISTLAQTREEIAKGLGGMTVDQIVDLLVLPSLRFTEGGDIPALRVEKHLLAHTPGDSERSHRLAELEARVRQKIENKVRGYIKKGYTQISEEGLENLVKSLNAEIEHELKLLVHERDNTTVSLTRPYGFMTNLLVVQNLDREVKVRTSIDTTILNNTDALIDSLFGVFKPAEGTEVHETLRGAKKFLQGERTRLLHEPLLGLRESDPAQRGILASQQISERSSFLARSPMERVAIIEQLGGLDGINQIANINLLGINLGLSIEQQILGADTPTLSITTLTREFALAEVHASLVRGKIAEADDSKKLAKSRAERLSGSKLTGGAYDSFATLQGYTKTYDQLGNNKTATGVEVTSEEIADIIETLKSGVNPLAEERSKNQLSIQRIINKISSQISDEFGIDEGEAERILTRAFQEERTSGSPGQLKERFISHMLGHLSAEQDQFEQSKNQLTSELAQITDEVTLLKNELKSAKALFGMEMKNSAEQVFNRLLDNYEIRSYLMRGLFQRAGAPMGPVALLVTKLMTVSEYNQRHGNMLQLNEEMNRRSVLTSIGSMMFNFGDFDGDTASVAILSQYTRLNAIRTIAGLDAIGSVTAKNALMEVDKGLLITAEEQAIRMAKYATGWQIFSDSNLFGTSDLGTIEKMRSDYQRLGDMLSRAKEIESRNLETRIAAGGIDPLDQVSQRTELENRYSLKKITSFDLISIDSLAMADLNAVDSSFESEFRSLVGDQNLMGFHRRKRGLFGMAQAANQFASQQQEVLGIIQSEVEKKLRGGRGSFDFMQSVEEVIQGDTFKRYVDAETSKSMRSIVQAAGGGDIEGKTLGELNLLTENQMKTFFVMTSWAATVLIGKTFEIAFALHSTSNKRTAERLSTLRASAAETFLGDPTQVAGKLPRSYRELQKLGSQNIMKFLKGYVQLNEMGISGGLSPEEVENLPENVRNAYKIIEKGTQARAELAGDEYGGQWHAVSNALTFSRNQDYINKAKGLLASYNLVNQEGALTSGTVLILQQIARDAIKPKTGDFWRLLRQELYGEKFNDIAEADSLVEYSQIVKSGISLALRNPRVAGIDALHQIIHGTTIHGKAVGRYEDWGTGTRVDSKGNPVYAEGHETGIRRLDPGIESAYKRDQIRNSLIEMYEDYFADVLDKVNKAAAVSGVEDEFVLKEIKKTALKDFAGSDIDVTTFEQLEKQAKAVYDANISGKAPDESSRVVMEEAAKIAGSSEVTSEHVKEAVYKVYAHKEAVGRAVVTEQLALAEKGYHSRRMSYMRALNAFETEEAWDDAYQTAGKNAESGIPDIDPSEKMRFFGEAVSRGKITNDVMMRVALEDILNSYQNVDHLRQAAEDTGIRGFDTQLTKLYEQYHSANKNFDFAMRRLVWAESFDGEEGRENFVKEVKKATDKFLGKFGTYVEVEKDGKKEQEYKLATTEETSKNVYELGERDYGGKLKQLRKTIDSAATDEENAIKDEQERRKKILERFQGVDENDAQRKKVENAAKELAKMEAATEEQKQTEIMKRGIKQAKAATAARQKSSKRHLETQTEAQLAYREMVNLLGGPEKYESAFVRNLEKSSIVRQHLSDQAMIKNPNTANFTSMGVSILLGAAIAGGAASPAEASPEDRAEKAAQALGMGMASLVAFANPSATLSNSKMGASEEDKSVRLLQGAAGFVAGAGATFYLQQKVMEYASQSRQLTGKMPKFTLFTGSMVSAAGGLIVGSAASMLIDAMAMRFKGIQAFNPALQSYEVGADIMDIYGLSIEEMEAAFNEEANVEVTETVTLYHPTGEAFTFEGYVYNTQSIDAISDTYDSPLEGGLDTYIGNESFEMSRTEDLNFLATE